MHYYTIRCQKLGIRAHCWKITQKCRNFTQFFGTLIPPIFFATQSVNVARFARNVEWDFFCDFQTLWNLLFHEFSTNWKWHILRYLLLDRPHLSFKCIFPSLQFANLSQFSPFQKSPEFTCYEAERCDLKKIATFVERLCIELENCCP